VRKILTPRELVRVRLPASLIARMSFLLWSEAHGRIPYGQVQEFIELAVREKVERAEQEIANGRSSDSIGLTETTV
jgi:hypothetical protein